MQSKTLTFLNAVASFGQGSAPLTEKIDLFYAQQADHPVEY